MATDRAQDTEAIRAARELRRAIACLAVEVPGEVWDDVHAKAKAVLDENDRLVARLEAAQTELGLAVSYIPASRIAAYRMRRAALAAAAPGETTLAEPDQGTGPGGTAQPAALAVRGACLPSGSASAAPGETEQTP